MFKDITVSNTIMDEFKDQAFAPAVRIPFHYLPPDCPGRNISQIFLEII